MNHKVLAYTLVGMIFAAMVSLLYYHEVIQESNNPIVLPEHKDRVNSFQSCANAGFPIMESFPEQCRSGEGLTFVNYEMCTQVIARAKNPENGDEREFPTPCDVPVGWERILE